MQRINCGQNLASLVPMAQKCANVKVVGSIFLNAASKLQTEFSFLLPMAPKEADAHAKV